MKDVAEAVKCKRRLLNLRPHRKQLCDRSRRLPCDHLKCDELTEGERSIHDHVTAEPEDNQ